MNNKINIGMKIMQMLSKAICTTFRIPKRTMKRMRVRRLLPTCDCSALEEQFFNIVVVNDGISSVR